MKTELQQITDKLVMNAYHFFDYVQMSFEGNIGLNVNNKFYLENLDTVNALVGMRVLCVEESEEKIIFEFADDVKMIIDMSTGGYKVSPEALELSSRDSIFIWRDDGVSELKI